MNITPQPPQDVRDSTEIFAELKARTAGYTPELVLTPGTPGAALGSIFARYVQTVLQRLNRAPGKNKIAFLDVLGLQPSPAHTARAPIVFQLNDKALAGIAPRGTGIAAPAPPGSSAQIVFETEAALSVAPGKIAEVFSLYPGRDSFINHSDAYKAGLPLNLFAAAELESIPHHLYLAHEKLFALAGNATLNLDFQFLRRGDNVLDIAWEYWDGKVWRGFFDISQACQQNPTIQPDGTAGMSRDGRIQLTTQGAASERTTVAGIDNFWIRGRLKQPLLSDSAKLPIVEAVQIGNTLEQPFRAELKLSAFEKGNRTLKVHNFAGQPLTQAIVKVTTSDDPSSPAITLLPAGGDGNAGTFLVPPSITPKSLTLVFFGIQQTIALDDQHQFSNRDESLTVSFDAIGISADTALADATKLDTTKPFYPFGQQPQPGSTFYFSSQEAFAKSGADLSIYLPLTSSPLGSIASTDVNNKRTALIPQIEWEYWNGRGWGTLAPAPSNEGKRDFSQSEVIHFTVPPDMEPVNIAGTSGLWMRARLVSGGFGYKQEVSWQAGAAAGAPLNTIVYIVNQPPVLAGLQLSYTWQYGPFDPAAVVTYNDFLYKDLTADALRPGGRFSPYERSADVTPALYIGLDKQPPGGQIGILLTVEEQRGDIEGPALVWEYWNGDTWTRLLSNDGTRNLRLPGIVALVTEDDSAALARFNSGNIYWIRGRLKDDGPPGEPVVDGIFLNATWASQRSTLQDVPVGQSNGAIDQVFHIPQIPILDGERIEVRELAGARAEVEWRVLALELFNGDNTAITRLETSLAREGGDTDFVEGDLRLRRDRLKRVSEAWVHWTPQLTLSGSSAKDRHYTIDRARGVLVFGDAIHGRVPPDGASILARFLQTGGGEAGNVAANTITQIRGVVPGIQAAFNPIPAEGGADGEPQNDFVRRGPSSLSHRGRAVDADGYATLAREASSAVGFARAIPTRNPAGRPLRGWVTVLVIPKSLDPRPQPSFGLRQAVQDYIAQRAPAELAGDDRIWVTGPSYLEIDVSASIAPIDASQAGIVEQAARDALAAFLHPLTGGPSGEGWDLGRSVFLSDVAAALSRVAGVDHIDTLTLLLNGQDQGESVAVGPDRIAVAGAIRILITAPSR